MVVTEWEELSNWLLEYKAIDETLTEPEMVKRLDLSGQDLETLPDSFGLLTELISLNLSSNSLTTLPESCVKLEKLSNLDIRRNKFETLPSFLSSLPLRALNANGNRIEDIEMLSACKELRVLDLSVNALSTIEHGFEKVNILRSINLSCNYLKDVSVLLESLPHTERLDISGNMITKIPDTIDRMQKLLELNISDNRMTQIDDAFFTLGLESVDLSSNQLESLHLKGLDELESLILDFNPLNDLTIADGFAPYLESFSCDGCGLDAFLPLASTTLKTLCYSSNNLVSVPEQIGQYVELVELDLDENNISQLPDSMANLSQLKTLYIEGNPLSESAKKVVDILHPEICDIHMKRGITIERAKEEDLSAMADLLSILFVIEQDFEIDYDKQLAGITKLYQSEGKELLVAKYEGEVVGMVTMQRLISSAEGDYIGQIEDLVVKENYRKMGVGSRLLNKMRGIAQEYGYKRIQLAADIDNDNAQQFYTRRGFHQTNLKIYHYNA